MCGLWVLPSVLHDFVVYIQNVEHKVKDGAVFTCALKTIPPNFHTYCDFVKVGLQSADANETRVSAFI